VLTAPFIYCKKYSKVIEMVGFSCHEIQLVFSWLQGKRIIYQLTKQFP
jgi:hypothetical protein